MLPNFDELGPGFGQQHPAEFELNSGSVLSGVANCWSKLAKFGRDSTRSGRTWSNSWQHRSNFGRSRPESANLGITGADRPRARKRRVSDGPRENSRVVDTVLALDWTFSPIGECLSHILECPWQMCSTPEDFRNCNRRRESVHLICARL